MSLSNFPSSLDNIPDITGITSSDYQIVNEYYQLLHSNQFSDANTYISQYPDVKAKIDDVVKHNLKGNAINAIEMFLSQHKSNYGIATWDSTNGRFIITTSPPLSSLSIGTRVQVTFSQSITWASDGTGIFINVAGTSDTKALKTDVGTYSYGKTLAAGTYDIWYNGTEWILLNAFPKSNPSVNLDAYNITGHNIVGDYVASDGTIDGQIMSESGNRLATINLLSDALAPIKSVNGPIKSDGSGNFSKATAADMAIADAGGYYASGTTEGALQEAGASLYFPAMNQVANGDFSGGTTGWATGGSGTLSTANNILSNTGNGSVSTFYSIMATPLTTAIGHKYYGRASMRVTDASAQQLKFRLLGGYYDAALLSPAQNQWYQFSGVAISPTIYAYTNAMTLSAVYADTTTANNKVLQTQYALMFDLTAIFGAGNEPTAAQMDALLSTYPNSWLSGTANLFSAPSSVSKYLMAVNNKSDMPVSHPQARALQPRLAGTATGDPVATITDAAAGAEFSAVVAKGRTTVTGTPPPDAPATISGVSPTQVTIQGKNWFDKSKATSNVALTWANGTTFAETNSLVSDYIQVFPGITYTVNYKSQACCYDKNKAAIAFFNDSTTVLSSLGSGSDQLNSFTIPSGRGIAYIRLGIRTSANSNLVMSSQNIQLELGSTATAYTPYTGQTIALSPSAPMYSLPDGTADTYDVRSGVETHNLGKLILTGNEGITWTLTVVGTTVRCQATIAGLNNAAGFYDISSHFQLLRSWSSDTEHFYLDAGTTLLIYINTSRLSANTSAAFNTWLSSNNVTIVYKLATPTVTQHTLVDIPQPSLIANVTADGAPVSVDYTRDLTSVLALKADKAQEVPIMATAISGWTTSADTANIPRYFKDNFGIVHFCGRIANGTANQSAISMPAGYRVAAGKTQSFYCPTRTGTGAVRVDVQSGSIVPTANPGVDVWIDLSEIAYLAEA